MKLALMMGLALANAKYGDFDGDKDSFEGLKGGQYIKISGSGGDIQIASVGQKKNNGFLKLGQRFFYELDPSGRVVSRIGKKDNSGSDDPQDDGYDRVYWTAPITDTSTGITTTSFAKNNTYNGAEFYLTLHIASTSSGATKDYIRCTGCTVDTNGNSTRGSCKNPANGNCAKSIIDPSGTTPESCPTDFAPCSVNYTVVKNTVKYSFRLSNWAKHDDGTSRINVSNNKMTYGIRMQQSGRGHKDQDDDQKPAGCIANCGKGKKFVFETGFAQFPAVGTLNGDTANPVAVTVTTKDEDSAMYVNFTFSAIGPTDQFYYDPTMASVDPVSGATSINVAASILILLGLLQYQY